MALSFDDFVKKAGGTAQDVKVAGGSSSRVAKAQQEADDAKKTADQAQSPLGTLKETGKGILKTVVSDIVGTGESLGEAAAAGDVAKNVAQGEDGVQDTALRVLKQIKANREAGKDTARLEQAYNNIAGHTQESDLTKILPTLNKSNFDAVLEAVGVGASVLPGGAPEAGAGAVKAAAGVAKSAASKVADEALEFGSSLRKQVQTYSAKHTTVGPQLEESAKRLSQNGTGLKDPVAIYDSHIPAAKKALTDIKIDPPIAKIGEDIGDAFKTVVAQRRTVGKSMETELKKTAAKKVDVKGTLGEFQRDLIDNGVTYDTVSKSIIPGRTTKFSDADNAILERYATDLQKLGSSPTMAELDAFVSRMPKEIDGLKASRNITSKTNAERIISTHLDTLRGALTSSGTQEYKAAREAYSKLSSFIDEGASHLGKITQSGDFAKDASLAKSAVQSILNNGKKDWLIKLEGLTGYKALDNAVLALQAMKDAGDFRGLSLLQTLADGAVPTSQAGWTQKIIDFALQHASKAVAGSPEEQTRSFLKTLGEAVRK